MKAKRHAELLRELRHRECLSVARSPNDFLLYDLDLSLAEILAKLGGMMGRW